MPSADDLLEQWLAAGQDLLKARKGSEREAALEERIAQLEARFEAKPEDEKDEALEEITDEEYDLIRQHRAGTTPPPADPPPADPPADPPATVPKTRPGRKQGKAYHWTVGEDGKVEQVSIPTIYNGPDEDDEVELPADEPAADAA